MHHSGLCVRTSRVLLLQSQLPQRAPPTLPPDKQNAILFVIFELEFQDLSAHSASSFLFCDLFRSWFLSRLTLIAFREDRRSLQLVESSTSNSSATKSGCRCHTSPLHLLRRNDLIADGRSCRRLAITCSTARFASTHNRPAPVRNNQSVAVLHRSIVPQPPGSGSRRSFDFRLSLIAIEFGYTPYLAEFHNA